MKFGQYILLIGFIGIIFSFGSFSFLAKDRESSILENRTLAQAPVKDPKLILSGAYSKSFETYFSDQFIGRDKWVEEYNKLQLAISPTYVNGYYVTKDDIIIQKPIDSFDIEGLDFASNQLNELGQYLKKRNINLYFFSNPSKLNLMASYLPSYLPKGRAEENQEYFLSRLNSDFMTIVDISGIFKERYDIDTLDKLYFKTDHHWNSKGAFPAYQTIIETISKDFNEIPLDYKESDYIYTCISGYDNFIGSWNKNLSLQVNTKGENHCNYEPKHYSFDDFIVFNGGQQYSHKDFYATLKYKGKTNPLLDSYGGVFTRDYREYKMINKNASNDLKVLIIKDSFMNAIPFHMAHHFKETTYYDMRYNFNRSVYDYLENHTFDLVIVAYDDTHYLDVLFDFNNPASQAE